MKLIENECSEALTRLLRPYYAKVDVQNVYHSINKGHSIEDDSNLLTLLIMEYFGNPPLKFEELKENMWVWDNYWKEYFEISEVYSNTKEIDVLIHQNKINQKRYETIKYTPNRFYRKEVQE